MDTNSPQDIIQNVVLRIEEQLQLGKAIEQVTEINKHLKSLDKTLKRQEKLWKEINKIQTQATKTQKRIKSSVKDTQDAYRKSSHSVRRHARETKAATRANAAFSASFLKIASVSAVAFAAWRKFQSIGEAQLKAALALGPGVIQRVEALGLDLSERAGLRTLGGVAAIGPQQRYGLGDNRVIEALLRIQESIKGVGEDLSSSLVVDLVKSFGADRRRFTEFVGVVNTQGIELALKRYATPSNIETVDSILNALQMTQQSEAGTLDPILQVLIGLKKTTETLDRTFEKLVTTLTAELQPALSALAEYTERLPALLDASFDTLKGWGISPSMALGVGAGAALLGPSLLRGGAGFTARGGGAVMRGAGALVSNPIGAGVVIGTGAALAIDHLTHEESLYEIWTMVQDAHERAEKARQQFVSLVERNVATAQTDLERLVAERQSVDVAVGKVYEEHQLSLLAQFWGYDEYAPEADKQAEALRQQREQLTAQIEAIRKTEQEIGQTQTQTQKSASTLFDVIRTKAIEAAEKGIAYLREQYERLQAAIADANLEAARQRAAVAGELALTASERATVTELRRLQLQFSGMTPFGKIASARETKALVDAIAAEIATLEKQLANIDRNTAEGRSEANKLNAQIMRLRIEERQARYDLQRAFVDAEIGKYLHTGIGHFEKIIIDHTRNVARGLEVGILRPDIPHITGKVGPEAADLSHRPQDALSVAMRSYGLTKGDAEQLKELIEIRDLNKRQLDVMLNPHDVDRPKPQAVGADSIRLSGDQEGERQRRSSRRLPDRSKTIGGDGIGEIRRGLVEMLHGVDKLEDHLRQVEGDRGVDNLRLTGHAI